ADRHVGAGSADHQIDEVGTGALDAHVEPLLVQKLDDVGFSELPAIGTKLPGVAKAWLEAQASGATFAGGPTPACHVRLHVGAVIDVKHGGRAAREPPG